LVAIAGVGGGAGDPCAGQAADAAADQRAQQVGVGGVAPSVLLVGGQPPLHQVELLSRHQRGDWDGDPLLGWVRRGAYPLADRLQRRLALSGRSGPQPAAGGLALVGRGGQQPTDRRRPPDRPCFRVVPPLSPRPPARWPLWAGLVSSPRMLVGRQIGLPVGVGTPLAVSCTARVCRVTPPAAYAANRSWTTAAATVSNPTSAGARGGS